MIHGRDPLRVLRMSPRAVSSFPQWPGAPLLQLRGVNAVLFLAHPVDAEVAHSAVVVQAPLQVA